MRNAVEVERRPGPLEVSVSGEGAEVLPCDAIEPRRALVRRGLGRPARRPRVPHAQRGAAASRAPARPAPRSSRASPPSLALQDRPHGSGRADRAGGADRGPPRQRRRRDRRRLHARARRRARRCCAASSRRPASRSCSSCPITRSAPRSRASRCGAEVPRADAVYSLQRTALLVHALATGDLDALPRALDDRLHQPDRSGADAAVLPPPGAPARPRRLRLHALGRRPEHAALGARRRRRPRSPRASRRSRPTPR